jgi:hypothetical protein
MAMLASRFAIVAALLLGSAAAQEEALPAADFLEYLGSWEGAEDEWLLFDEQEQQVPAEKRSDAESRDDEATEDEDEN